LVYNGGKGWRAQNARGEGKGAGAGTEGMMKANRQKR